MVLAHDIKTIERTEDVQISVDVNFESMLLKKETLNGLEISGFYKPSPVQLHGIPLGKCGFDLFLEAKSGTGKTAVFSVIALEKLDLLKDLQSIILAPTREIAAQICDVIKQIGSMYNGLNVEVVMGGLPIGEDIEKLKKKVHILVGSPGRMRHLIQEKHIDISAVRLLVLDEADKLMDKSFQSDINYIFSALPKQKQVIMSSATYPETLKTVMKNYVHKVQHICPDSTAILLGINQFVTTVESHPNIVRQTEIKFKELLKILTKREFKQCLIFCNYQIRVVELCKMLIASKWPAEQLHAQLDQSDRLDALKTLQEYKCRILVSTDLAARGIDASNVDLVINFEPPYEWQTYLHRMGRAGRFGAYGIVITILSVKEIAKFGDMIRSYSSSLNLVNLWDNNAFTFGTELSLGAGAAPEEDLCSLPEETAVEQKILDDDYDLTLKSKIKLKDKCDVESFGMLVNSFENSKEYKIESFSDLIASLEFNKQEENKICPSQNVTENEQDLKENEVKLDTKKCIHYEWDVKSFTMLSDSLEKYNEKEIEPYTDIITSLNVPESVSPNEENEMKEIVSKNRQVFISNEKSKSNTVLKDSSNSDTDVETVNETHDNLTKNVTRKSHSPEDFGVPCIKSYLEAHIKENSSKAKIYKKQTLLDSTKKEKVTSDLYDCHKALLEAGLPTAFGSTKTSYNQYQPEDRSNKHKFVKNKKESNFKREDCGTSEKKITEENQSKNTVSSESGYIDHPIAYNGSTKYDRHSKNKSFSEMANNINETSPNSYEKYVAWYNQLKTHVKHVEMSLFMSELSNY